MSARDAMAAMLDELMGPKRNVELGKDTTVTFEILMYFISTDTLLELHDKNVVFTKLISIIFLVRDPDICKYYIVGFCPHDMFVNTKADLGKCCKSRRIRKNKEKLKTNEEYGQVCCFIFKCIALKVYYMKIDKNYQFTQLFLQKKEDERKQRSTMEIVGLDEEIKKCIQEAEKLRLNFYSCSLSRALLVLSTY
uniref:Transmembrane protein n=1 Tax=Heterorhabditis bacteriophora TaxID=37862 RepID=A0A1I7X5R8_HETBA